MISRARRRLFAGSLGLAIASRAFAGEARDDNAATPASSRLPASFMGLLPAYRDRPGRLMAAAASMAAAFVISMIRALSRRRARPFHGYSPASRTGRARLSAHDDADGSVAEFISSLIYH